MKKSMKKMLKLLLVVFMFVAYMSMPAFAADSKATGSGEYEGVKWELSDEGTLTISAGSQSSIAARFYEKGIPEEMCDDITKLVIEQGITSIGEDAFRDCDLESITIPNSVTSIGIEAFAGNYITEVNLGIDIDLVKGLDRWGVLNVKFLDGVTSIGTGAFKGCDVLRSVTLPNSVTSIGAGAFKSCRDLERITISNRLKSIGREAFYGCSSLKSITLPNSVTSIGAGAFVNCGFKSITIPNGVTSIENDVFRSCYNLKSVTIPNSVKSIKRKAFSDCFELKSITIPNSVKSMGKGAFYSCTNLKSIVLPNSLTSLGENVFYECDSLKSITIPNSVTSLKSQCDPEKITYKGNNKSVISKLFNNFSIKEEGYFITARWAKVTKASNYKVYKYNGKTKKWSLMKKITNPLANRCKITGLKPETNYKIKLVARVKGKDYICTKSCRTYPGKVANLKLTTGTKHYVKAKWNSLKGASYYYLVQIATNSAFKEVEQTVYTNSKTTQKTFNWLVKGKTYYVRVCAYNGKTDNYGPWSNVKKIKCK